MAHKHTHGRPPGPFTNFRSLDSWTRSLWQGIELIRQGKLDCIKEDFTLTANQATSTLTDQRLSPESVVILDPKTANAAAELAAGTLYCLTANRGAGSWVFTCANNAQADRTYQVAIIG